MDFSGLDKISGIKLITYGLSTLSLIVPGAYLIFYFQIELFERLDFFKLIILSVAYSLPLHVIASCLSFVDNWIYSSINPKKEQYGAMFISFFHSTCVFIAFGFPFLLINFILKDLNIKINSYTFFYLLSFFAIVPMLIVSYFWAKKETSGT